MKIHENMLLDKSLESLEKSSDTIDKWKKYDLLNIILFPEGTTYNNVKSKNVNKKIFHCMSKNLNPLFSSAES